MKYTYSISYYYIFAGNWRAAYLENRPKMRSNFFFIGGEDGFAPGWAGGVDLRSNDGFTLRK